jgi:hypothetical protein
MHSGSSFRSLVAALAVFTFLAVASAATPPKGAPTAQQAGGAQKPNIVMLMTDDTGWNDFGAYSGGGLSLGHPTPNIDKMAKEGAVFSFLHHRTHPNSHGAFDRGCAWRRELPQARDSNHC